MPKTYLTIAKAIRHEEVVKGSRFICMVQNVETVEEAFEVLGKVRQSYPDASHHCLAYSIDGQYRFNDDGEPSGTAGRPMYEVLNRRKLNRVVAVVTRYFGGTKLGAGGLVRAYSGSLAKTLDLAGVCEVKPRASLTIMVPFAEMDSVHRFLDNVTDLQKENPDFTDKGMNIDVTMFEEDVETFKVQLKEITRGQALIWTCVNTL